jgi:hypothetical protein
MPFNQGGMQGGMTGGMFGPPGGPQNLGGSVMSDQELQMLLGQMGQMGQRGGSDVASFGGGTLPIYDMPAQLPQGTPSLGTTGIDPSMMAGAPPAPPTDFGVQDIAGGMQGTQQALMNIGMEERRRRLAQAAQGGGMGGGGAGNVGPWMQAAGGPLRTGF